MLAATAQTVGDVGVELYDAEGTLLAEGLHIPRPVQNGSFETGTLDGWSSQVTGDTDVPWQVSGADAGGDFGIDRTVTPISLSQSFREGPTLFTDKTKRILSLIMGYTILHLHGTSWLQEGVVSADIQFFQTVNRKTPLRPFLQVQLEEHASSSQTHMAEESKGLDEGEDLDMDHRCILLVDLAVVLIELHFVSSFKDLAKARDIQWDYKNIVRRKGKLERLK